MIQMKRNPEPHLLGKNKKKWTKHYVNSRKFSWHNNQEELLELLKKQSLSHCAFCERAMSPAGDADEEIEHFRPKSTFLELAYEWTNLFPICPGCNKKKGDRFDELLLKPDSENFRFDDWFMFDPLTGKIEVKYSKCKAPERAEKTIELYGLNRQKLVNRRLNFFQHLLSKEKPVTEWNNKPFRYMQKYFYL